MTQCMGLEKLFVANNKVLQRRQQIVSLEDCYSLCCILT